MNSKENLSNSPLFDAEDLQRAQKAISNTPPADIESVQRVISERDQIEMDRLRVELTSFRNDIKARKLFAWLIFALVVIWLGAIIWIVIATGSGWYKLSDTVLITLVTSTTVNITGFFLIVTQYIFPSAKKD